MGSQVQILPLRPVFPRLSGFHTRQRTAPPHGFRTVSAGHGRECEQEAEAVSEMMTIAWRDFLLFAAICDEMQRAFTNETGIAFPAPPKNGMERLIDEATGALDGAMLDFAFY